MTLDLEQIRSCNLIEEVIAKKFPLKKRGSRFISVEHDSLVIVPDTGSYFWNSRGEQKVDLTLSDGMCCHWSRLPVTRQLVYVNRVLHF